MHYSIQFLVALLMLSVLPEQCSSLWFPTQQLRLNSHQTAVRATPRELEGQLNLSQHWDVTFRCNGIEKVAKVCEDKSLLEAGERIFDNVESSCRMGVCTTCAAKVIENIDSVNCGIDALSKSQRDAGFICTCQSYASGPGIVLELGKHDECYECQYGPPDKECGSFKANQKQCNKLTAENKEQGSFLWSLLKRFSS